MTISAWVWLDREIPVPHFSNKTVAWWGFIRTDVFHFKHTLGILTIYAVIGLAGDFFLRRIFRLNLSMDVFYLRLFLLLLPLQTIRLLLIFSLNELINTGIGILATRIAWFTRFSGLVSLLCMGLYISGMSGRSLNYFFLMGILASLLLSAMLPFDMTQPMGNWLYRSSLGTPLTLFCIILELIVVGSYLGISTEQINKENYWMFLFQLLLVTGNDMSYFVDIVLSIPGLALMIAGIIGLTWRLRRAYQWL